MRIKKLLLRLGSEKLIKLIDNDIFKILQLRKNKISSSKNLTELILQLNSEKTILSEKTSRDIIIDALKTNEAELIGKLFNFKSGNFLSFLKNLNYNKLIILESFFKIFEIEFDNKNEIRTIKEKTNPIVIQPNYALFMHQIEVLNK